MHSTNLLRLSLVIQLAVGALVIRDRFIEIWIQLTGREIWVGPEFPASILVSLSPLLNYNRLVAGAAVALVIALFFCLTEWGLKRNPLVTRNLLVAFNALAGLWWLWVLASVMPLIHGGNGVLGPP